ncbi:MAG TPA: pitrilysin family protein, partial [Pyrinomonadaceae bacterium]|nr:pitrilysin family protein [Pyrinomonadaceae bacterium]
MTQAIQTTVPEPLEPVAFELPAAFVTTLSNGLRVVIFDDDRIPLCSFRLAFMSGDAGDPNDLKGLTSAMTSLVTEGTSEHTSAELAEKIERLGASLSASSSHDFSVVAGSALSMYRSEILELMAETVFAPVFPENELALYRQNTLENLKFQRSQPNFLAGEQTARLLYGKHPYGTVSPTPADVERLTREHLERRRQEVFLPNNAVFIAVGDVQKDQFLLELEDLFGDWESGDRHIHKGAEFPTRSERSLTIVDRPGSAQANIVLANPAINRDHPDYFPVIVMNQILGAGASSRVFMNLREEKGYTYGAYTRLDTKRFGGHFEATAEVRTAVTGESLKEFFYELERIREDEVLDGELDDAKNFLTGVFPIKAETQEGLTNLILNQELYGLPHDYLQTYRDNVDAVTAADVQRVANAYVLPDASAMVIVGDAREILEQAREYCSRIEIMDKNGKEIDPASYTAAGDGKPANAAGKWALSLDFQ